MRYFKAIEILESPYLNFALWAKSEQELISMGLEDDPLIIEEDNIPTLQFGVYNIKIEGGEIVSRTTIEMDAFEVSYNEMLFINEQKRKFLDVNSGSFSFDSKSFPMDESSRLFYSTLERKGGNHKPMTVDGALYSLSAANTSAFIDAFNKQLNILTQPDV